MLDIKIIEFNVYFYIKYTKMLLVLNLFRPSLLYHQYSVLAIFQVVTLKNILCRLTEDKLYSVI